jgi:hypothetical protein
MGVQDFLPGFPHPHRKMGVQDFLQDFLIHRIPSPLPCLGCFTKNGCPRFISRIHLTFGARKIVTLEVGHFDFGRYKNQNEK